MRIIAVILVTLVIRAVEARAAAVLCWQNGLTQEEAAEVLERPLGTV